MAGAKKKARRERRILVFIDESGLSQRPHRCRTWAPRGQTPILQYNFNWKSLSVAAGQQIVDFLAALVRHLGQPLLIVWDRLPGHRSRLVQEFIAGLQGWISTACLPQGLLAPERSSATNAPSHAPPSATDHRLLEAIFSMARIALYYARFSNFASPCVRILSRRNCNAEGGVGDAPRHGPLQRW